MKKKLTSRKFWLTVTGQIAGLTGLFCGVAWEQNVLFITGAVIMVFVTIGYLKVEGDIDIANLGG
jgi:hypothetical protein